MASLSETLCRCFENDISLRRPSDGNIYSDEGRTSLSFMTIPLKENDVFEVPVNALRPLSDIKNNLDTVGSLAMALTPSDFVPYYKTLDATVRHSLFRYTEGAKLLRITNMADAGPYYCSFGAIYDSDYYPIMMCSWLVQAIKQPEDSEIPYTIHLVKPILRVDPQVFIDKSNPVERYIVNKIVPSALTISPGHCYRLPYRLSDSNQSFRVKVEIDKCPFRITKPVTPTIETTNEALLSVALDNIDDIIK